MAGGLPICRYDAAKGMFRVVKHKGKTLSNGGFGVTMQAIAAVDNTQGNETRIGLSCGKNGEELKTVAKPPDTYLFIEEGVFLHEQGLIELWNESLQESSSLMDSKQLYALLEGGPLSLPVYLVYAHLRAQTYRVVRHTQTRKELIDELMAIGTNGRESIVDDDTIPSRSSKDIKADLRQDAASASPPTMYEPGACPPTIAFDVYPPDSNFKRSDPGLPAFHVAICSFVQSSPTFGEIQNLLVLCGTIPLRIATVADSGTVVMFAVTDFGVPNINSLGIDDDDDNNNDHHDIKQE